MPRASTLHSSPLLHPSPPATADDLGGEDEGLRQDAEEQVQVKAVLYQAPTERLPAGAVCAGG